MTEHSPQKEKKTASRNLLALGAAIVVFVFGAEVLNDFFYHN